jgi:hypothetical protein
MDLQAMVAAKANSIALMKPFKAPSNLQVRDRSARRFVRLPALTTCYLTEESLR